ncbi:MAG: alpha/beta hydrolase fold protein, partial [Bacteroidota bacterium]|nr:alpha/beta hydrolase fold protein [Bacteroidota bacterium]
MNKTLEFKGTKYTYNVEGTGPALMLVHGFIEEGSMWSEVVKALKKKYRIIIPDLPGFGASPMVPKQVTLSMELYAEYLFEILKQEKIKKLILLGHSMGGYVTLNFAEKYGPMLRGFGLLNSHCFEDTPEKKANRKKGIEFIKNNGTKVFITELYNNIFHPLFKKKN